MRKAFHENYPFTETDLNELWNNGIIVFDTNLLLNWYRYSDNTIQEFNKILKKFNARLWIPYHVGKEFHQQRTSVILQQVKVYNEFTAKLKSIEQDLSNINRNPFLSQTLYKDLSSSIIRSENELNDRKTLFENYLSNDPVLETISDFYDGKVGKEYNEKELESIKQQGAIRYKNKIPPGYMDHDKPENDKFGDLIIWNQMIAKAKEEQKPVLFVTDDRKEDWWSIKESKLLGPRPELRKEFKDLTGQLLYIYKPFRFLQYAYEYLKIKVDETAIQEVKKMTPLVNIEPTIENSKLLITIEYLENDNNAALQKFIDLFHANGYELQLKKNGSQTGKISITIPNISDLERRIQSKFVSQIENYGLTLINYKVKILSA